MVNILLTNTCVRQCPYCFAGEEMTRSPGTDYISWDDIVYVADLLEACGEKRVSLLGGEPSLHPEFLDILLYFVERRFRVNAFTCGIMSNAKLQALAEYVRPLPVAQVNFVCNINNPAQTETAPSETAKLHDFLAALGPWTMPAFNIYRPDFALDFLFELVERYGMKRRLRLGIAHPIPGAENISIPVEEIGDVIARICGYRSEFERLHLRPSFDCGFPLCKVSDEQLGWLMRLSGGMDFKCRPAIDITPDMQVYSCFPLAGLNRKSVFEFNTLPQIVGYFTGLQNRIRAEAAGIFDECRDCMQRNEGTCAGGGVCQIVNRLSRDNPQKLHDIERAQDAACLSG